MYPNSISNSSFYGPKIEYFEKNWRKFENETLLQNYQTFKYVTVLGY